MWGEGGAEGALGAVLRPHIDTLTHGDLHSSPSGISLVVCSSLARVTVSYRHLKEVLFYHRGRRGTETAPSTPHGARRMTVEAHLSIIKPSMSKMQAAHGGSGAAMCRPGTSDEPPSPEDGRAESLQSFSIQYSVF